METRTKVSAKWEEFEDIFSLCLCIQVKKQQKLITLIYPDLKLSLLIALVRHSSHVPVLSTQTQAMLTKKMCDVWDTGSTSSTSSRKQEVDHS